MMLHKKSVKKQKFYASVTIFVFILIVIIIFLGTIIFKKPSITGKAVFDVETNVLPEYKQILQGEKVLIQNILFNLRGFGAGDVKVKYAVKDSKGNLIASEEETIFIETEAKFVRELVIPEEIKPGTYMAFVEASANGAILGTGSDTFDVKAKYEYKYPPELKYYLIALAVLVALAIIFILAIYGYGMLKKKQKIIELKEKEPKEKMEKLKKELKALEEGCKAKLISEESYKKEKKRLEEKLGFSKK